MCLEWNQQSQEVHKQRNKDKKPHKTTSRGVKGDTNGWVRPPKIEIKKNKS